MYLATIASVSFIWVLSYLAWFLNNFDQTVGSLRSKHLYLHCWMSFHSNLVLLRLDIRSSSQCPFKPLHIIYCFIIYIAYCFPDLSSWAYTLGFTNRFLLACRILALWSPVGVLISLYLSHHCIAWFSSDILFLACIASKAMLITVWSSYVPGSVPFGTWQRYWVHILHVLFFLMHHDILSIHLSILKHSWHSIAFIQHMRARLA